MPPVEHETFSPLFHCPKHVHFSNDHVFVSSCNVASSLLVNAQSPLVIYDGLTFILFLNRLQLSVDIRREPKGIFGAHRACERTSG